VLRIQILTLVLTALAALPAAGQVSEGSPFRALSLPAPSQVRTGAGRPGSGYWQQRADYLIRATLDPATQALTGRETIHYTNHSPDPLPYLWLQVEQNICAPGSVTNLLDQPPLAFLGSSFDFSCKEFAGGLTLESLTSMGRPLVHTIYGTMMRVDLSRPLRPGLALDIDVTWRFTVPPYGAGRMGHDGELYELGQWYPRMAVYDDVKGWNHEPYIGAGEFYLEYGSFDVALTVPATYIVAATGVLQNPLQVLTATQRGRLLRAKTSDTAIAIITKAEAGDPAQTRPLRRGTLTWRFRADSVRDFAFAAAPNFQWDASGWNGIGVHTYYRPGSQLWHEANRIVREAVRYYSQQWYHYPYPHISSIEGPIEGMEYPMMTFDPAGPTRIDLQWVLAHELGHQWMPMIVGVNERLYPWMDEGFNTFIDLANAANYFVGTPYGDSIEVHPLHLYPEHAIAGQEQPLITPPVESKDLFWTGYQKPALMMAQLRDQVLGKERFDAAFREYLRTWAFKHPTPADFFRLMRDHSGQDLDWFWREWVLTTARLDQAVDSVKARGDTLTEVYLSSRGDMVMPLTLGLVLQDREGNQRTQDVALPVEMWYQGPRFTYRLRGSDQVVRVAIDPSEMLPDVNRANNGWSR
jgi:Peptidase family M1 domain